MFAFYASEEKVEAELRELCKQLRLLSARDTEGTLAQVLKVVVQKKVVGGTELARISGLNRITCIHHLKRLESAGMVKREGRKYKMRFASMRTYVKEIRIEMEKMLAESEERAAAIDREFCLGRGARGRKK